MKIGLGVKVSDRVTGFTGIVTSRTEYLYEVPRYGVTPQVGKDGKFPDTAWFDEPRLIEIDTESAPPAR